MSSPPTSTRPVRPSCRDPASTSRRRSSGVASAASARAAPGRVRVSFAPRRRGPARLAQLLQSEELAVPRIPVYSNTTGKPHASEPADIAQLLPEHLVESRRVRDRARGDVSARSPAVRRGRPTVGSHRPGPADARRPRAPGGVGRPLGPPGSGVPAAHHRRPRERGCAGRYRASFQRPSRAAERPQRRVSRSQAREGCLVGRRRPRWPADSARRPAAPIPDIDSQKENPVINTSSNGAGPPLAPPNPQTDLQPDRSPPPANETIAAAPPAAVVQGPPLSGDRVADVMLRHQQVMQQFLETQRAVMLSYLGPPRGRRRQQQRFRRRGGRFRRFPRAWSWHPLSRRRRRRGHTPRR